MSASAPIGPRPSSIGVGSVPHSEPIAAAPDAPLPASVSLQNVALLTCAAAIVLASYADSDGGDESDAYEDAYKQMM